jgi:hypothetical protein
VHSCFADCGAKCGDGYCSSVETRQSCCQDCVGCGYCGDGVCLGSETSSSCCTDCGGCNPCPTCSWKTCYATCGDTGWVCSCGVCNCL